MNVLVMIRGYDITVSRLQLIIRSLQIQIYTYFGVTRIYATILAQFMLFLRKYFSISRSTEFNEFRAVTELFLSSFTL